MTRRPETWSHGHLRNSGYQVTAVASVLLVRNPAQPIVLVTGDPDEALARDALSRGPLSYLLKPFELDASLQQAIVRTAASVPNAREQMREESVRGEVAIAALEEWLQFVDQHSYAGPAHADRVSRIAATLLACLPEAVIEITPADLMLAARAHEIGKLEGPTADPTEPCGDARDLHGGPACGSQRSSPRRGHCLHRDAQPASSLANAAKRAL